MPPREACFSAFYGASTYFLNRGEVKKQEAESRQCESVTLLPEGPQGNEEQGLGKAARFPDGTVVELALLPREAQAKYTESTSIEADMKTIRANAQLLRKEIKETGPGNNNESDLLGQLMNSESLIQDAKRSRLKALESLRRYYLSWYEDTVTSGANTAAAPISRSAVVAAVGGKYIPVPTMGIREIKTGYGPDVSVDSVKRRGLQVNISYSYINDPGSEVPLKIVMPQAMFDAHFLEMALEDVDAELKREILNPIGLKTLYAMFLFAYEAHDYEFVFDTNRFLDVMGYGRDKRGAHRSINVNRVHRAIELYEHLWVRGEVYLGKDKGQRLTATREERILTILAKSAVWRQATASPSTRRRIIDRSTMRISPIVYSEVLGPNRNDGDMFTWIDSRMLEEDIRRKSHETAFLLYLLFGDRWRTEWQRNQCVYTCSLQSVLCHAGVTFNTAHIERFLKKLKAELDYLVQKGYIKSWSLQPKPGGGPLDQDLRVIAPDDYPVRTIRLRSKTARQVS